MRRDEAIELSIAIVGSWRPKLVPFPKSNGERQRRPHLVLSTWLLESIYRRKYTGRRSIQLPPIIAISSS